MIFVPGVAAEFFEFDSHAEMQRRLPELFNASGNYRPWQLLALQDRDRLFIQQGSSALAYRFHGGAALTGDALAHSALSRLDTQLTNEWGRRVVAQHGVHAAGGYGRCRAPDAAAGGGSHAGIARRADRLAAP